MPWQLTSPGSSEYSKALATPSKAAGPGSVRAEDAEGLPLLHGEGEVGHRDGEPAGLAEMLDLND